ncbi:hypothetical protein F5887DRAFT_976919 [Amanita rubescens]|nr:hypothetical protein F5887DRAFT_976919 [Amanita rubescens]
MHFVDVALEVQLQILQFCSPQDLAILSLVHSSLRDAAEYVLYSHIDFSPEERDTYVEEDTYRSPWESSMQKTSPLLSTLDRNARKASTVKAFYIELGGEDYGDDNIIPPILVKLAGVLKKMPNLVDLRIMTDAKLDRSDGKISEVISGNYFKLHTLYLDCYYEFEGILACQSQLRFLGLYNHEIGCRSLWEKLKRHHLSTHRPHVSSGPAIFEIDFGLYEAPPITIFPAFHLPGEALSVFRELLVHPKNHDRFYENGYDLSLSFLGISEHNVSLFCEAMDAMAICAHHRLHPGRLSYRSYTNLRIIVHETTLQKPWISPEFVKSLAQFESALYLQLYFPNIKDEELFLLSADLQEHLLKHLGHGAWVRLRAISLQGPMKMVYLARENNWVPEEDEEW